MFIFPQIFGPTVRLFCYVVFIFSIHLEGKTHPNSTFCKGNLIFKFLKDIFSLCKLIISNKLLRMGTLSYNFFNWFCIALYIRMGCVNKKFQNWSSVALIMCVALNNFKV